MFMDHMAFTLRVMACCLACALGVYFEAETRARGSESEQTPWDLEHAYWWWAELPDLPLLHTRSQISAAKQSNTSCQAGTQTLLSPQIGPGSLKNFAAQLKEGAIAERLMRPQFFALMPDLRSAEILLNPCL